jgi:hypothetical protein
MILTELCQYLHNWFDRDQAKFYGKFIIDQGNIQSYNDGDMGMIEGQYFRIIGSLLNDGVHQYPPTDLVDETFDGAIWFCALPPAVVALSGEIHSWVEKYSDVVNSPYQQESFGGYSYTLRSDGSSGAGGGGLSGWRLAFRDRLNPWRKIA